MVLRALLAICLFAATANGRAGSLDPAFNTQVLDRIVAVVDGAPITQSDVAAATQLGLVASAQGPNSVAATIDALVERRLILEEVDRYAPPEPVDADIDRHVVEIRARLGSRFTPTLAEVGLTEDQLRREVRDTLRIDAYLLQRFGAAQPSDERATMIRDWLAGLRRRANINILPR